jgi:hypothetical protein
LSGGGDWFNLRRLNQSGFVLKRVISPIYLVDAVLELGLVLWWTLALIF